MLAGGVVSTSAAPFDTERGLAALAGVGRAGRLDTWFDDRARLGCDEDGDLFRARDRQDRALVVDGPIHNLDALRQTAGQLPDHPLFGLWDRYGPDAADQVAGDMAFALWDGRARRLVLARDPGGYRPLFFWTAPGQILFASEPRGLLADARVPKTVDEAFLAEWLAILPRPSTRTAFSDIQRVPPGHAVIWENGRLRLHRFWRPEARPTLRFRQDEDYADALRETLVRAVGDHLPASGEVGSHLSGGLDSGAVTALAARALAGQGRRLTAFTAVPGGGPVRETLGGRLGDEGPLAALTAARHGNVNHLLVPNDSGALMAVLERRTAAMDCPVRNPVNAIWMDAIERKARDRGVRVLLIGALGNFTLSYDGQFAAAQMLLGGRWLELWRILRDLRRVQGRSLAGLAATTFDPLLPAGVKYGVRRLLGRGEPLDLYEHAMINPDRARASGVESLAGRMAGDMRNFHGADSRALRLAVMDRTDHRSLWRAATRRLYGVDMRDPTCDRRLIDLCLSMPEEQFVKGGHFRSLGRRALANVLPAEVLAERRRGLQAADWPTVMTDARQDLTTEVERLRASPAAARLVDLPRLEHMLADWPSGDRWASREVIWGYLSGLNRAVATGHFIRRVEGGNG